MTRFLKLSSTLLNVSQITKISIKPKHFDIHFTTNSANGISLFGFGVLFPNIEKIKVCSHEHPDDYKIIKDWIRKEPLYVENQYV
jgi:hypothetical protein